MSAPDKPDLSDLWGLHEKAGEAILALDETPWVPRSELEAAMREIESLRQMVHGLQSELTQARRRMAPTPLYFRDGNQLNYALGSIDPYLAEEIRSRMPKDRAAD